MTKVEAIIKVMNDYNGIATLQLIYNEIEKYYPNVKNSKDWTAGIRGVLYRELGKKFKRIDTSTYALIEYDDLNLLPFDCRIGVTEKEILTSVRLQQNKYRNNLLKVLKMCPFTGITDKRLLVASHIKPWCLSTSEEKMDIYNGFILSPLYDRLFDSGLITFTNEKKVIYSSSLSKETMKIIKYKDEYCENLPIEGREEYLYFHNTKIFRK